LVTADLNGDGATDVATANRNPASISVLLNPGSGPWPAATSYPTGPLPGRLVVADLDRDGAWDLTTANAGSHDLTILWGAGDGTFTSSTVTLGAAVTPRAFVVADLDLDSWPDLVTANAADDSVAVVRGRGERQWGVPRFFAIGTTNARPRTLAVGDVNEDGLLDLVVGHWQRGRLSVLLVGDTGIAARRHLAAGLQLAQVAVGDFNADGDLDVAAVSLAKQAVQIFDGDGKGHFAAPRSFPTGAGPVGLAIGQVDTDGIADLVVAERDTNAVGVMYGLGAAGSGNGGFATALALPAQEKPLDVAVFDADQDGFADLAVCNRASQSVSIYMSSLSGSCSPSVCDDGNSCTVDYCSTEGRCRHRVLARSSPCDDGLFCTTGDRCSVDTCIGIRRDCSHLGDLCQYGMCNEDTARCATELLGGPDCVDPCAAPARKRAFRVGRALGMARIRSLWRNINDCDQVEAFEVRVVNAISEIEPPAGDTPPIRQCRFAGRIEGVIAQLEHLQAVCSAVCYMDGDLVGHLAAKLYCDLAIDSGGELEAEQWFRQPVNVCGLTYQVACDTRYLGDTKTYSNDLGSCLPYTEEPFWEVWERTRLRCCDYHNDEAP
jgi:hypothetical protein